MEELKKLVKVSLSAMAAMSYCYYMVSKIPPGKLRLFFILPLFYLFALLPCSFSSIHLRGIFAFFLTWLASFKLLLFAFNAGPLSSHCSSLLDFISIASLPIKYKNPSPITSQNTQKKPHLLIKAFLLVLLINLYPYSYLLHEAILHSLYTVHMYLSLEILLAAGSCVARVATRLELERLFDEPYLSTSLQDFWGRRWNLTVTNVLRPTVYDPLRAWAGPVIGPRAVQMAAVVVVLAVSGLMHEVMFCYLTEERPTWEVTWFFLLHGACLAAEIAAKKAVKGRFRLPVAVSRVATLGLLMVTSFWLFFPPIVRTGTVDRTIDEYRLAYRSLEKIWRR